MNPASESGKFSAYQTYIDHAEGIASGCVGERHGFGALREYVDIAHHTIRAIVTSRFLRFRGRRNDCDSDVFPYRHFDSDARIPRFFLEVLSDPANLEPSCVWALFWALAKAEHQFLERYVPYWSHEERLTGHLVSQMIDRLEDFSPHWRALGAINPSREVTQCRLFYADTATAKREGITGSDLGFIIQACWPGGKEFYKCVRFQAKKVEPSGKARIDLSQVGGLLRQPSIGYYLFYHPFDTTGWSLTPTVVSAEQFKRHYEGLRDAPVGTKPKSQDIAVNDVGIDLATFVTFSVADPTSKAGYYCNTPNGAITALMCAQTPEAAGPGGPAGGDSLPWPSRVLVVTLGAGTSNIDWLQLLDPYLRSDDEPHPSRG